MMQTNEITAMTSAIVEQLQASLINDGDFCRINRVATILECSESKAYEYTKHPSFPRPRLLPSEGKRPSRRWIAGEVREWGKQFVSRV